MATVLVTGSNRGIGLALCRVFRDRGDRVLAVCRHSSPALAALGVEVLDGVDGTSDADVAALARRLAGQPIDVLVLNAGILREDSLDDVDLGDVVEQLQVNAVAPLRLARALSGTLRRGSRVALITSRMGSMGDNGSGGYYGYRMSKAALNAAGVSLARDLADREIAVAILHPGYVRTDMTGQQGNVAPDDSARLLVARIDELTLATSGSFRHANGETLPW
jgi:NAD(P)-dependent dehydrogenase (short-subunit alcohol dehydrogenase family)